MALPTIQLTGNLTADPELRFTQGGKPVCTIRVASTERRKNEVGDWIDGDTVFLNVVCWRNAEAITDALQKGNAVQVIGTLRQRTYEAKDGTERTVIEVNADSVAKVLDHRSGSNIPKPAPADDPWANEAPF